MHDSQSHDVCLNLHIFMTTSDAAQHQDATTIIMVSS